MTELEGRPDRLARRLSLLLTVAVLLGLAGLAASVYNAQQTRAASAADVERARAQAAMNELLIRRLDERTQQVCRIVYDVATAAGITVEPCVTTPLPELDDLVPASGTSSP